MARMTHRPPLIDTSKLPEPELRSAPIGGERYTSREFMEREWDCMWARVWNIGALESEIPEAGDFVTHDLGPESLLFVRDDDGRVRGYYNVCHHRGNRLVSEESGQARMFVCPYHAWVWSRGGDLLRARDPEDFPQGDPCGKLQLTPVRVETWGGFIWFNLNPDADTLADYLQPVAREIDTYRMERMVRTHYITLEIECNWKVIQDNFNESYHIPAVHPQLKYFLDDTYQNTQFDLYPNGHNRMLMLGGGPSPRAAGEEDRVLKFMADELAYWGLDVEDFRGRVQEMRPALQARKRELGPEKGFDFSGYVDGQLTDHYHYTLFPNLSFSMKPDGCIFLRAEPHPRDPGRCFFDVWYFTLFPEGSDEHFAASMSGSVQRGDPVEHQRGQLGDVFMGGGIDQDASVFVSQQKGLRSRAYGGGYLANQERRVVYYHQVLDDYLEGRRG
jgi:phenylpropionate dioxygenase-like ring-hydroxylating dioxygenase large terminal subunit